MCDSWCFKMSSHHLMSAAILLVCCMESVMSELCSTNDTTLVYCSGSEYCCGKDQCCSYPFSSSIRIAVAVVCSALLLFGVLFWCFRRQGRKDNGPLGRSLVAVTVAPPLTNANDVTKYDAPPPYSTVMAVTDVNAVPNGYVAYEVRLK